MHSVVRRSKRTGASPLLALRLVSLALSVVLMPQPRSHGVVTNIVTADAHWDIDMGYHIIRKYIGHARDMRRRWLV